MRKATYCPSQLRRRLFTISNSCWDSITLYIKPYWEEGREEGSMSFYGMISSRLGERLKALAAKGDGRLGFAFRSHPLPDMTLRIVDNDRCIKEEFHIVGSGIWPYAMVWE